MTLKNDNMPQINKEWISNALKNSIGAPMSRSILESVQKSSEQMLSEMEKSGVLNSSKVDKVQTIHQSKKFFGRIKDFVLWKTFAKRWYYKPFYVKVPLDEHLRMLWDHSLIFDDMSEVEAEAMFEWFAGMHVWLEEYPQDPYTVVLVDICMQPVIPVDYVEFKVEI